MKRVIFLILVLFSGLSFTLHSANYFKEGTIWHMIYEGLLPEAKVYKGSVITLEKVTNIQGSDYLVMRWVDSNGSLIWSADIISEGERVYRYFPDVDAKYLIYDFSLKPGESTDVYYGGFITPESISKNPDLSYYNITRGSDVTKSNPNNAVDEYSLSVYSYYSDSQLPLNTIWIDGIGTNDYPLYNIFGEEGGGAIGIEYVESDGEVIYRSSKSASINSVGQDADGESQVYNLNGVPCVETSKGVVIINGKKIMK